MFDFSFPELMTILVIALIVIGPERLPKVARTLGHFWGRAQRYVNGVKSDIARDMAADEFREMQQKVQAEASAVVQSLQQTADSADQQVQAMNSEIASPVSDKNVAQQEKASRPSKQTSVHPHSTQPVDKSE